MTEVFVEQPRLHRVCEKSLLVPKVSHKYYLKSAKNNSQRIVKKNLSIKKCKLC